MEYGPVFIEAVRFLLAEVNDNFGFVAVPVYVFV